MSCCSPLPENWKWNDKRVLFGSDINDDLYERCRRVIVSNNKELEIVF